ncbi:MAG: hypothetical protein ACFHXK_12510 [bacterium]
MSRQIFVRVILLGLIALGLLLALFSTYGWQQGFAVGSGLWHLMKPRHAPAVSNVALPDVAWQQVTWMGDIENVNLRESSGLTASPVHDNVLWSINDSGSAPTLFALDERGADLGEWPINVDKAVDWESLDSFVLDGVSYLVIGDTGDNFRWRPFVWLLVVAEPTDLSRRGEVLDVAWKLEFSYPEGFRDSEAMAVDIASQSFYVLSKRHYPPELFRLPLQSEHRVTAEFVREMVQLPRYTEEEYRLDDDAYYRHMPSGMDIAGDALLITTYQHAYLFSFDNLDQDPLRVMLPSIGQRESISFAKDSDSRAYVTKERHEGKGVADVFRVDFSRSAQPSISFSGCPERLPDLLSSPDENSLYR